MKLFEMGKAEKGVKGAAYGAASGAGAIAGIFMLFSAPISIPVVATFAVLGAITGWFGDDTRKKKPP